MNIFMPAAEPIVYTGQVERAQRIPKFLASLSPRPDIIVLQESIVGSQHRMISDGLKSLGWTYETMPVTGPAPMSGGIVIFSVWPILNQHQQAFEGCLGSDCLCNKGFSYARISVDGTPLHVIGTHFQAWLTPEAIRVRRSQADAIGAFVRALEGPVVVCGDLNIDTYSEPRELKELCARMGVASVELDMDSHPFSSDPATNTLVGLDGDEEYASARWPRGCRDELTGSQICPCCPQELLDYVCVSGPIKGVARVVPAKSEAMLLRTSFKTSAWSPDLSDHFPVQATLQINSAGSVDDVAEYVAPERSFVLSWYAWIVIVFCALFVVVGIVIVVFMNLPASEGYISTATLREPGAP